MNAWWNFNVKRVKVLSKLVKKATLIGFALGLVMGALLTTMIFLAMKRSQQWMTQVNSGEIATNSAALQSQNWPVYENQQYKLRFRYPPHLVLTEERSKPEGMFILWVRFVDADCIHLIPQERSLSRTESPKGVKFFITPLPVVKKESLKVICGTDPICRERTSFESIPLQNGLHGRLTKIFGADGDAITLSVAGSELEFSFSTGDLPHICGKQTYIEEIFQMAETLEFR